MSQRTSKQAILACKCPRCREGDMFKYSAFRPTKFDKANEHCPVCGLKFEIEPSFFTGAMYVSYAFSVFLTFIVGISVNFFYENAPISTYMFWIILLVLLAFPHMFRYSRSLYMHIVSGVKYDEKFASTKKAD